ncbi:hypothetical protein Tdes44962_MAKER09610, partial [Teratosphaeria destructans]
MTCTDDGTIYTPPTAPDIFSCDSGDFADRPSSAP